MSSNVCSRVILDTSSGLLVVIDGSKGLRSAIRKVLRRCAVVQRCRWHTRENVVSHLPRKEQSDWRRRLKRAYSRPTYDGARLIQHAHKWSSGAFPSSIETLVS